MLYLMRGLPGSGKSTWIRNNWKFREYAVLALCADDYLMIDGKYQYTPQAIIKAHDDIFRRTIIELMPPDSFGVPIQRSKYEDIVIDNTGTQLINLAPYIQLAASFNVPYEIVYLMCDVETSIRRNTHNVPPNVIIQMNRNLLTEVIPPFWKQRVILPAA